MYLIWSFEHGMWWGPMQHGYTANTDEAGRYSIDTAGEIAARSVLLDDIAVLDSFALKFGPPKYHPYNGASK